jgi:hypothetical protein
MSCGVETEALSLLKTLTDGVDFAVPVVNMDDPLFSLPPGSDTDLYKPVARLNADRITTGKVDGTGTFDVMMRAFSAHLKLEKDAGRISGAEYTKAYVALIQAAMQSASSFEGQAETLFWQSQAAQIAAITARVSLMQEKVKYAALQYAAHQAKAEYALSEMKVASESVSYCSQKFNLDSLLPLQAAGLTTENAAKAFNLTNMLPIQYALLQSQAAGALIQNDTANYNLKVTLPTQHDIQLLQQAGQVTANATSAYNLNTMLPLQSNLLSSQAQTAALERDTKSYQLLTLMPLQAAGLTIQNTTAQLDHDIKGYTLSVMMPLQSQMLDLQKSGVAKDNQIKDYNIAWTLVADYDMKRAQADGLAIDKQMKQYNLQYILPMQLATQTEQLQVARAQTQDGRTDGSPITGTLGAQKNLYNQQIQSYLIDGKVKVAKIFSDAWVTQKTMDEGVVPPGQFTNASLDPLLAGVRQAVGI